MFWGFPVMVATLPMLAEVATASRYGSAFKPMRRVARSANGTMTKQMMSLTKKAESKPVIKMTVGMRACQGVVAADAARDRLHLRRTHERDVNRNACAGSEPVGKHYQPVRHCHEERRASSLGDDRRGEALVAACIQGKHGDDFLFTRENGQPVRDIRDAWATLFQEAGIEPRLLHDLRRSAARNMIRAGIDRDTVRKIGGWKTDAVFSRYNIQDVSDLTAAAKKIEDRAAAARRHAKRATDKKPTISI
jgi:Phage integrase family